MLAPLIFPLPSAILSPGMQQGRTQCSLLLPPSTGKRLSCTGWVLQLCHHSEVAPLGTAWQLFPPLGKETHSSCPLLTFGDADLEKQAFGRFACSAFVQERESES